MNSGVVGTEAEGPQDAASVFHTALEGIRVIDIGHMIAGPLAAVLAETFAREPCDVWCELLRPAGVGVSVVPILSQVMSDEALHASGVLRPARNFFGDITPGVVTGPWLKDTPSAAQIPVHSGAPPLSGTSLALGRRLPS